MKVLRIMRPTASLIIFLLVFLTGCVNRLQDYEPPYSTFDERMAAAEQGSPIPTDEQMPTELDTRYTDYSAGGTIWDNQPQSNYQPPTAQRRYRSSGNSNHSDLEVPFDNSRGPKHAANIGAL